MPLLLFRLILAKTGLLGKLFAPDIKTGDHEGNIVQPLLKRWPDICRTMDWQKQ